MYLINLPYLLVPLAGRSDLLLLILPVLVIFGIFIGVYLTRQRSNRKQRDRSQ